METIRLQNFNMVAYGLPRKFPSGAKGFLNPRYESAPRKQETFGDAPALTLGVEGFLGRKRFPPQETFCFLQSFLTRMTQCA
jgi:hypothetical protein